MAFATHMGLVVATMVIAAQTAQMVFVPTRFVLYVVYVVNRRAGQLVAPAPCQR